MLLTALAIVVTNIKLFNQLLVGHFVLDLVLAERPKFAFLELKSFTKLVVVISLTEGWSVIF